MTDNLRDRIAAVLYERSVLRAGLDFKWATLTQPGIRQSWLDDADAVIRELRLKREELGGFRIPGYGHRGHRYVTEWKADE